MRKISGWGANSRGDAALPELVFLPVGGNGVVAALGTRMDELASVTTGLSIEWQRFAISGLI